MPDLEMKSLQTALLCHEDYTRKQIDVHGQSSVRARKSDLRRDMELRGGVGGEVEAEHKERTVSSVLRGGRGSECPACSRGVTWGGALHCFR